MVFSIKLFFISKCLEYSLHMNINMLHFCSLEKKYFVAYTIGSWEFFLLYEEWRL